VASARSPIAPPLPPMVYPFIAPLIGPLFNLSVLPPTLPLCLRCPRHTARALALWHRTEADCPSFLPPMVYPFIAPLHCPSVSPSKPTPPLLRLLPGMGGYWRRGACPEAHRHQSAGSRAWHHAETSRWMWAGEHPP